MGFTNNSLTMTIIQWGSLQYVFVVLNLSSFSVLFDMTGKKKNVQTMKLQFCSNIVFEVVGNVYEMD